jgi:hypothetical protein
VDELHLSAFRFEIKTQCEFVMIAVDDLADALQSSEPDRAAKIWCALQTILVSAANISKLLWGSTDTEAPRQELRDELGVKDDSPLRSKRVRNAFEHFDEYIDKMPSTGIPSRNIWAEGTVKFRTEPNQHLGHFDPVSGVVKMWDRSISLADILSEIKRIHGLLT